MLFFGYIIIRCQGVKVARLWGWVGCGGLVGWLRYEQRKGPNERNERNIYKGINNGYKVGVKVRFVHRQDKGETSKEIFYGVKYSKSKRILKGQGNKRQIYICLYFNALNYKGVLLSFRGCRLSH